ncbi:MAG: hypothetical protein ABIK28_01240 [Planctomycetota bacterium]
MLSVGKMRVVTMVVMLLLGVPLSLSAQEIKKHIDLEDHIGAPDFAFGMQLSPDGSSLYVAVPGHYSDNNNRLVIIDTETDEVIDEAVTEFYPEEIAFKVDGGGDIALIFISNSSSHSITVLKPNLNLVAHISLVTPPDVAWPFGLVMDPGGRYLYVSTMTGRIFVVDTELGATYLQVVQTYLIGEFNCRMSVYNNLLLIAGSDSVQGALLHIMDLNQPGQVDTLILDNNTSGWPGANDVQITQDGYAYVTVWDWNVSSDLYEVDLNPTPPSVTRVIDLGEGILDMTQEHGICASADGNTLVVTYIYDAYIRLVGRKTGTVLDTINVYPEAYGEINEALFSQDGKKLYLSDQSSPNVHLMVRVPEHGLILKGTDQVLPGGTVEMDMLGGETGRPGLLFMSLTEGQVSAPTFTMDFGLPFWVLMYSLFNGSNKFIIPDIACPNDPGLSGLRVYLQGLTQDADYLFRPSNLHIIDIL